MKKIENLANSDIVGIYFSAHWCPPCRMFTPELAKVYNDCKAQGKKFEVIFISADKDNNAYAEYFKEQPWLALPYKERDLMEAVQQAYDITGYPTLVLLDSTGKVLDKNGRSKVQGGAEAFPWGLI